MTRLRFTAKLLAWAQPMVVTFFLVVPALGVALAPRLASASPPTSCSIYADDEPCCVCFAGSEYITSCAAGGFIGVSACWVGMLNGYCWYQDCQRW